MSNDDKLLDKQHKEKVKQELEFARFKNMCKYEDEAFKEGFKHIAGIDEAGRGPLAGPVVAACVILPQEIFISGLNDSKKLSSAKRDILYDEIIDKAIAIGVGISDEKCIDDINILNATKKAMEMAVSELMAVPDLLLIDAVKLDTINIKQLSIIKGDSLSVSIAAASIIAKVTRDRLIEAIDNQYPEYNFKKHKGYGTEEHINAIKKYGICPIHRLSFTKNIVCGGI